MGRIGLEVVERVFEAGPVDGEIHRVSPVALADRADMAAGAAGWIPGFEALMKLTIGWIGSVRPCQRGLRRPLRVSIIAFAVRS